MKPRNYEPGLTAKLKRLCPDLVAHAEQLGYEVFVADQSCGRCYYRRQHIIIPAWIFRNIKMQNKWLVNYMAHELAHAMCHAKHGIEANYHGPKFYAEFKAVCPPEYWYLELSYKPRNAKAAGIRERK